MPTSDLSQGPAVVLLRNVLIAPDCPHLSPQITFPPLTLPISVQLASMCPGCAPYLSRPSCLLPPHLTVVWGQLMEQLLDPVFLPGTVDIGDLVLWEAVEKLVYLGGNGG